jgi:hypothetical protein
MRPTYLFGVAHGVMAMALTLALSIAIRIGDTRNVIFGGIVTVAWLMMIVIMAIIDMRSRR